MAHLARESTPRGFGKAHLVIIRIWVKLTRLMAPEQCRDRAGFRSITRRCELNDEVAQFGAHICLWLSSQLELPTAETEILLLLPLVGQVDRTN